jgi:hypothetical protein
VHGALGGEVAYPLAEGRSGSDVDLAGNLEDGAVAARPGGLDVEFWHRGSCGLSFSALTKKAVGLQ